MTLATTKDAPNNETALAQYRQQHYNILLPTDEVRRINPYYQMRLSVVHISSNAADEEVYQGSFCKQNEFALRKKALERLAKAANIQWDPDRCKRIDDRKRATYAEYQAVGGVRNADGLTWTWYIRSRSIDLEAVPNAKISPAERQFIAEHAETKAMMRVIRAVLDVKQKYTKEELAKPFVVPHLDFSPDFNDPDVRSAFLAAGTGAVAQLYGSQPTVAPPQLAAANDKIKALQGPSLSESIVPSSPGDTDNADLGGDDDDMDMGTGNTDDAVLLYELFVRRFEECQALLDVGRVAEDANRHKATIGEELWVRLVSIFKARKKALAAAGAQS